MTRDLDLDGVLKEWPAPSRADSEWEAQADTIVARATAAPAPESRILDEWLAPPDLAREPGEPWGTVAAFASVGDRKMADEKDATEPPRKRQSLKEIAERASQAGASRPPSSLSPSSLSTPLPGRTSSPSIPSAPTSLRPSTSTPLPRASVAASIPSRPVEAGAEDSGIVDLGQIHSSATPEQKAAAEKAQPGQADLFEDDKPAASAAPAAASSSAPAAASAAPAPAAAAPARAKKGSGGAMAGVAIAAIGIAAAFFIMQRGKTNEAPPAARVAAQANQAPATEATQAPTAQAAAPTTAPAEPTPAVTSEPAKEPVAAAEPPKGGPAAPPQPGAPAPAAKAEEDKAAQASAVPPPATAKPGEKPGDLASAMEKAVGPVEKNTEPEKAEPAAGGTKSNGSIPEQPPQGSVSAAMASVMGAAKACVAGADDVSRATITFSSSGAVSNVSVSGWAASNGASGCIKNALKGANVGPFSKPSFTVGVTIRP